jgi:hypothetical protein
MTAFAHCDNAEEVGVELAPQLVERHIFGETAYAEAGVVDQQVDAAVIFDNRVYGRRNGCESGDVELPNVDALAHIGLWCSFFQAAAAAEFAHVATTR